MEKMSLKNYVISMVFLVLCLLLCMPAGRVEAAKFKYSIDVNRKQNVVIVYKKGKNGKYTQPVKAMVCSVGVDNRTPKGNFKTSNRYRWRQLFYGTYGQYATRICGSILFHSVGYNKKDPSTLQFEEFNKLGTSASHGCVRLSVEDAKWIYDHCKAGTPVHIYDSNKKEPLNKPETMKISKKDAKRKWDPTDLNKKNPWLKVLPTIRVQGQKAFEVGETKKADLLKMATAKDFRGNSLKVSIKGTYNLKKIGEYTVTFSAIDRLGNRATRQIEIRVQDTIAPVLNTKKIENLVITDEDLAKLTEEGKEITHREIAEYLKQYVTAKDQGKKLDSSYIIVNAEELLKAYLSVEPGKKAVEIRAKDEAGNVTDPFVVYVQFERGKDIFDRTIK
ncbi:MAG: hypothetical protein E7280_02610 [Lachnospiraceae bacterium]|jgi:hypothetical protein|nr:hypothetical protein [Lachnospiraceae bacterium]